MTKAEKLAKLHEELSRLPDDRLSIVAELIKYWSEPTIYASLSEAEKEEIREAVAAFDRGETVEFDDLDGRLEARLRAAGA